LTGSIATAHPSSTAPGSDLRDAFRAAYENRYTWPADFPGYEGRCSWQQEDRRLEGRFRVGADLKASIEGIEDAEVHKAIASQLWEVTIHRVRRPFEQTHGENTFTAGDSDAVGTEVIVGGKGQGDRYRIKDDVVTMVHRHIHGSVVTIFTTAITETGAGYLSHTYSSQYSDPASGEPRGSLNRFTDTFVALPGSGHWVLAERVVETEAEAPAATGESSAQTFRFEDLAPLS
jgi:hypothetical protein